MFTSDVNILWAFSRRRKLGSCINVVRRWGAFREQLHLMAIRKSMTSGISCISSVIFRQGKGHSRDMNLNEPSWIVINIVIQYWSICTDRSEWLSCTTACIHEAGRGVVSCSRTLQRSRCLLSWDWLEPKTHRVKTFHPAAWWRGADCCLQQKTKDTAVQFWDSVAFKGSRVQYSAKITLLSDASVLFSNSWAPWWISAIESAAISAVGTG